MNIIKELMEKRAKLSEELADILEKADAEKRAVSEEEARKFEETESEIRAIDRTVALKEKSEKIDRPITSENRADDDLQAFAEYLSGRAELRAGEQNVTMSANGDVMPQTIAKKIIDEVHDICPIFKYSDRYHVKGTLKIPKYTKNASNDITVGLASEFTELTANAGSFSSIDLDGHLFGGLVLVGKSVMNNADIDVASYIIQKLAEKSAYVIEKYMLNGTGSGQPQGALTTGNSITASSSTALSLDELIKLQSSVKQAYQGKACWTMNPSTFLAVQLLNDTNGRSIIQPDASKEFPYTILGKPVYLSDNMPAIAKGAKCVLYGDYSGIATNVRENISIEILREKYATQHAVGIQTWFEFDSKVADEQKLAVLKMATS